MSTMLEYALSYCRLGLSVLPVHATAKKPATRWRGKQNERASEEELRFWFANPDSPYRLGLVCGPVSENLVVRDFDDLTAFERWAAAYPTFAETLPTVETGRPGRHVYFRSVSSVRTKTFGDGEFRGSGAFVVAPPSRHETGRAYQWLCGIPATIPEIDPEQAGLLRDWGDGNTVSASHAVSAVPTAHAVSTVLPESLDAAIRRTIPPNVGWREKCLFRLCRELQGFPELAGADPKSLEPIVRQWYELAEPFIGTKEYGATFAAFLRAWPNVKVPKGETAVHAAFRRIQDADHSWIPAIIDNQAMRLLAALCRELQRIAGSKPFFLDCRTAGDVLKLSHKTAWHLLNDLCALGLIEMTARGSLKTRKASEYRFIFRTTGEQAGPG